MRSATSYFNGTLYRKTMARFWPLWGMWGVFWLFLLPLHLLTWYFQVSSWRSADPQKELFQEALNLPNSLPAGILLAAGCAVLCAMAVFGFLYSHRSACWTHALPLRREALFTTQYLAGLSMMLLPLAAAALLTAIVEISLLPAANWGATLSALISWLLAQSGICLFFFSFAAFCAMFTGHILALPAFYAIFNFIVSGVTELVHTVLRGFYYGFSGFTEEVYTVVKWFTPVARLEEAVRSYSYAPAFPADTPLDAVVTSPRVLEFQGLGAVGIYAIAAVALAVCAFFLYRARRLESAGDVVSVKAMRPVFKYGVALCAGLALGMVTTMFIGGGEIPLMCAIVVWGVIGCFGAQMLLDKSFRVFRKWKGAAAVAAVFIALFLVVNFDLTGFETRIPDPSTVDSVEVGGITAVYLGDDGDHLQQTITDQSVIDLINILHREAVAQRDEERQAQMQIGGTSTSLELTYRLKTGGTLTRRYTVWLDPDEVNREGAAAWAVQQLYDNRELYWQAYGFGQLETYLAEGGRLENANHEFYDEEAGMSDYAVYYGKDAATLFAAMKEDFFAGRIAVRRVEDEEHWYGGSLRNYLMFEAATKAGGSFYVQISLQDTATSTLAALEGMAGRGVGPDTEIYAK